MPPTVHLCRVLALLALVACAIAPSAAAHPTSTGGAAALEAPDVSSLRCGTGELGSCPRGQLLRVSGENLAGTSAVVFLGRPGRRDDRRARPAARSQHRVLITVPAGARSGRLRIVTAGASTPGPRLRVLPAPARPQAAAPKTVASSGDGVFPVQGAHDFGTETNRFGGGRNHQGQDVFADCGTPLVAALAGEVTLTKFQDRAGHYVVIKADDGTGQAYMHLRGPADVSKGDRVVAGQPIGKVGDTGRATGCHLHFELWTAPGWYEGGEAIDPLPALKRWEAAAEPPPA